MDVVEMSPPSFNVNRPVFNQETLDSYLHKRVKPKLSRSTKLLRYFRYVFCSSKRAKSILFRFVPILEWLPKYPVKEYILGDIISGLSTAMMQLPQSLAYAILAAVPPVFGLYSSVFPVLLYTIFGTSRHVSIGTFAVISLMVGTVVVRLTPDQMFHVTSMNTTNHTEFHEARDAQRVKIAAATALLSGIMQLCLGLIRFGFVVVYLAEPVVRGFTTAAALHVFSSQLKYFLGIQTKRFGGPLSAINTFIAVCTNIKRSNIPSVILGAVCIVFLLVVKEINVRCKHKLPVPIPVELILVIITTGVSAGMNLHENYEVNIVGHIPSGLKAPVLPDFSLLSEIFTECIAIAIVGFSMTISMAKIFAMKHGYRVDGNQELIALGICNTFGSFFQTFPVTTSMSRSLVQETTGGKTEIAGAISAAVVLVILVSFGFLFECLPQTVLAAIVMVNLKGVLKQFQDIPFLWRICKIEFALWIVAFASSFILGLDFGLLVAVLFAIITVIYRTQSPKSAMLGQIPNTDIYLDIDAYEEVQEVPGVKIFQSSASLYFANVDMYVNTLHKKTEIEPAAILLAKKRLEEKAKKSARLAERKSILKWGNRNIPSEAAKQKAVAEEVPNEAIQNGASNVLNIVESDANHKLTAFIKSAADTHALILDFSSVSFIDSVGTKMLKMIIKEYGNIGINVFIAGCSECIVKDLTRLKFFDESIPRSLLFHSVHDAVLHYQELASLRGDSSTEMSF
ncbi:prestin isoform X1 [Chiloscyllium punctatum]|uniref:prestin isoform X1 n=3 Tax=Chiloscyllium punctatum TaxID=137246 RepID=UPI003B63A7C7